MEQIRIGIIGAGWVVQNRHLLALGALPRVSCQVIWSRDPGKAAEVARQFEIPRVAESWEKICESAEVDAVVVATPPAGHCPAVVRALEAGKHVLCQGRMARNLREAQDMARAARSAGRVAALYPPRPGLKGDHMMKRLLKKEKVIGQIREVRVTGITAAPQDEKYDWKKDPEVVGVNALTLGMWAEVLHRWVGTVTRLGALTKTHRTERRGPNDNVVSATVPDSISASAQLVWGAQVTYHLSEAAYGLGHVIDIYGSDGSLSYDLLSDKIRVSSGSDRTLAPWPISPVEERLHTTDAEFIDAIRNGGSVSPNFDEGLQYMEFCEAVALSALEGRAVDLPLPNPAMTCWGQRL